MQVKGKTPEQRVLVGMSRSSPHFHAKLLLLLIRHGMNALSLASVIMKTNQGLITLNP